MDNISQGKNKPSLNNLERIGCKTTGCTLAKTTGASQRGDWCKTRTKNEQGMKESHQTFKVSTLIRLVYKTLQHSMAIGVPSIRILYFFCFSVAYSYCFFRDGRQYFVLSIWIFLFIFYQFK